MSDINTELETIESSAYGDSVVTAIADALTKINQDFEDVLTSENLELFNDIEGFSERAADVALEVEDARRTADGVICSSVSQAIQMQIETGTPQVQAGYVMLPNNITWQGQVIHSALLADARYTFLDIPISFVHPYSPEGIPVIMAGLALSSSLGIDFDGAMTDYRNTYGYDPSPLVKENPTENKNYIGAFKVSTHSVTTTGFNLRLHLSSGINNAGYPGRSINIPNWEVPLLVSMAWIAFGTYIKE